MRGAGIQVGGSVGAGCAAGVPARRLRGRRGVAGARFAVEGDQPWRAGRVLRLLRVLDDSVAHRHRGGQQGDPRPGGRAPDLPGAVCQPELVDVDSPKRVAAGSDLVDVRSGLRVQPGQLTAVVSEVPEESAALADRIGRFADGPALLGGVSLSSSSAGSFAGRSSSATPTPPCSAVGSATSSTCAGTAATRTSLPRWRRLPPRMSSRRSTPGWTPGSRSAGVRSPVASGSAWCWCGPWPRDPDVSLVEADLRRGRPPRPASPSGSPSTGADDRRHDRQPAVAGPGRPGGADAARTGRRGREAPRPHGGRAVPEDRRARRGTDEGDAARR